MIVSKHRLIALVSSMATVFMLAVSTPSVLAQTHTPQSGNARGNGTVIEGKRDKSAEYERKLDRAIQEHQSLADELDEVLEASQALERDLKKATEILARHDKILARQRKAITSYIRNREACIRRRYDYLNTPDGSVFADTYQRLFKICARTLANTNKSLEVIKDVLNELKAVVQQMRRALEHKETDLTMLEDRAETLKNLIANAEETIKLYRELVEREKSLSN